MPGQVYDTNGQVSDDGRMVMWKKEPEESGPSRVVARSGVSSGLFGFFSVKFAVAIVSFVLAGAYVGAIRSSEISLFELRETNRTDR